MSDRVLGVGLVGVGWVAAQHLQAFKGNARTRIVAPPGSGQTRAAVGIQGLAPYWFEVGQGLIEDLCQATGALYGLSTTPYPILHAAFA